MTSKEIFGKLFNKESKDDKLENHYEEFTALKNKISFMARYLGKLKDLEKICRTDLEIVSNKKVANALNEIDKLLNFMN